jgi:UDP-glucose:(heptosyl)LPS alpha-1,3-glucosyltransferase
VEKKIRFAVGILRFSRKRGGAERYVVDLCSRMAREGYDVHVYTEHWEEEDRGISFHRIRTIPFPRSLRLLSFAFRATWKIDRGNYHITFGIGNTLRANVLQPHGGVHWAWFWRSLNAYDHPVRWMVKFLGRIMSPKQWAGGWIENAPYRMRNLPRFIAISEMVKQDMVKWYRIPAKQIRVVYNGVDIERFHPRNRQFRQEIRERHQIGDELVILFVSNNFQMKGLSYLLDALARMRSEAFCPIKLLVLGRDRKEPYLRMAEQLGILRDVLFVGTTDEPEKYYGAADLLVHPTFYDACSLTVLEALASGLPVITTSSNGAGGIITAGQEGFVLSDPREVETLVERISFFQNPRAREEAGAASRRLAEFHRAERNWEEMRTILDEAASEAGKTRMGIEP